MTKLSELKRRWMQDPAFKDQYDRIEAEFAIAEAMIGARVQAGMTQADLAGAMNTTQSTIARWESGKTPPSVKTLLKLAHATGCRLDVKLVPAKTTVRGRDHRRGGARSSGRSTS